MIRRRSLPAALLVGCLAAAGWLSALAAELRSPDLVRTALRIFAGVYGDMSRKLAARQFDRLPHENQECQEAAQAMRDAIAGEPAEFKARVESVLAKTLAASTHVAEVSKSHDEAQVKAALAALADSMRELNVLFPEAVRTLPGTVGPHGAPPSAPDTSPR